MLAKRPILGSLWNPCGQKHRLLYIARSYSIAKSPLRIALFGTDNFTVHSLKALHRYQLANPHVIESLHVITRTPKPSGRGLKVVKEAPSAVYAFEQDIPVLRAETDSDIVALADHGYNLAIAVSYGKLIPAQFLSQLTYGGINVHPSLLPDLSGAAPLHRALLRGYDTTGVTVQTLHPTKFDRGKILLHSPEVHIAKNETLQSLESKLGELGSECLVTVVDEYRFADPDLNVPTATKYSPSYAPKIQPKEKNINFTKHSLSQILLKHRILGKLAVFQPTADGVKRIILDNIIDASSLADVVTNEKARLDSLQIGEYDFFKHSDGNSKKAQTVCIIRVQDGFISPFLLVFQGYSPQTAAQFQKSLRKRAVTSKQLQVS
ncbi:Fmt1p [Sugiyamaella lignohabitans]|uniref:methionyl-tRNA formyltransferase n=1 Tax=Sugiyamaella lignohabitans TaxID=796027 RepID=A0A167EUX4_9ASCO|nr:Fmt1p [Sugiyamaella lignohabitans]ANB14491.1 Fmt1p [Sugiyamaella lignohabitans]